MHDNRSETDSMSEEQQNAAPEEQQQEAPVAPRPQSFLGEFWAFMRVRKKFWLAPIIIFLVLLGLLFLFASQAGVVSPFIYAL